MHHLLIPILTIIIIAACVRYAMNYELRRFRRTATTLDRCKYAGRSYLIAAADKDSVALSTQVMNIWVSRSDIYPAYEPDETR